MINTRWITPVGGFRGVYYVSDPEERQRRFFRMNSFGILIATLNRVLGDNWYFGRITAISLSGLMHQPVSTYYVINQKFSRSFESKIFGKVVLVKASAKMAGACGIIERKYGNKTYRICSLERNIADYIYLYVHGHSEGGYVTNLLMNYPPDKAKVEDIIIKCYPRNSAIKMRSFFRKVAL
ncbi:MAG: hypothetical protein AB1657_00135 [Candidatus Micrarchaeota archaeon]